MRAWPWDVCIPKGVSQLCFAFCSQSSVFSEFSLQAYSWVHASDVLNKNLCGHNPGICNKLRVDHCAPESVKSAATNSCPEYVPGPHPPILLALSPVRLRGTFGLSGASGATDKTQESLLSCLFCTWMPGQPHSCVFYIFGNKNMISIEHKI